MLRWKKAGKSFKIDEISDTVDLFKIMWIDLNEYSVKMIK